MYDALRDGRRPYRNAKLRMNAQIETMKNDFLSNVTPVVQSMICPQLAYNLADIIRTYYKRMERDLGPTILTEVRHEELCVAMLRCVLTPFLYEHKPEIISNGFKRNLVIKTLDSVPGLKTLSLPRENCTSKAALVARSISYLKLLQVFKYTRDCTDRVVKQLALNCSLLTEVSFLDSQGVTNASVPHILKLKNLIFLNVEGTRIDAPNYGLLVSNLENIADFRIDHRQGDALSHIARETINTIRHVYGIAKDVNMQIQKFPKTTKLQMTPRDVDLSGLTAWTELRSLEITYGVYSAFNLNAILTGIGHNLTELVLKMVDYVNLPDIVTLCKSLEKLTLLMCSFLPLNADTPLNPQLPHFQNLISLQVYNSCRDPLDFRYIRYYVSLQKITLEWVEIFSVEFMREVASRGTLANLKECYITESLEGGLTFEVLQLLIHHCSHLKTFGNLGWLPHLNVEDVLELERELLTQNFDFNVVP
jgi:hypothetical protein